MRFKLQFLARARLLAELVVPRGEAVFVPTAETPAVGTAVELEVSAPELDPPVRLTAVVKQLRPFSGTQPAGVLVKVDATSLEALRAVVGQHDDEARLLGRADKRVDCELAVQVRSPIAAAEGQARSLSRGGITLRSPLPLEKDQSVELVLTLPAGGTVALTAQVKWARAELLLAGLQFGPLDETTAHALERAVDVLTAQQAAGVVSPQARTVLVADDDASILDFTSRVVSKAGYRVVRADRGDLALELVRRERPHLVLLDVLMPGLDGLEVCKAIRADTALQHTQVLLLSAMSEAKIIQAAASCGADGYMTKPMALDAIRAMLAERLKP